MNGGEYQERAARTIDFTKSDKDNIVNFSFGLTGEAGEAVNIIKKALFHSHDASVTDELLEEELGDVLWYVAGLATVRGLSLETIMHNNIRKLERRYPNGFSVEASRNREDIWHD